MKEGYVIAFYSNQSYGYVGGNMDKLSTPEAPNRSLGLSPFMFV